MFETDSSPGYRTSLRDDKRVAEEAGVEIEVKKRFGKSGSSLSAAFLGHKGNGFSELPRKISVEDPHEFSIGPFLTQVKEYENMAGFYPRTKQHDARNVLAASSQDDDLASSLLDSFIFFQNIPAMYTYLNNPPNASFTILATTPQSIAGPCCVWGQHVSSTPLEGQKDLSL